MELCERVRACVRVRVRPKNACNSCIADSHGKISDAIINTTVTTTKQSANLKLHSKHCQSVN